MSSAPPNCVERRSKAIRKILYFRPHFTLDPGSLEARILPSIRNRVDVAEVWVRL
jgi:hypothetical protein